ncbi:MAG: DUF2868 domain-containing protein [Pseudomonadota bacterium]
MDDSRSLLARTVDIRQWLDADATATEQQRLVRDRKIGEQITAVRDYQRVLAWWQVVGESPSGKGARLVRLRRIANALLVLLGFFLGVGVASIALGYQGDYPVNLFALLGVLVGIPLLLLVVSVLLLAVGAPQALHDTLGVLSPGRWAGNLLERHLSLRLFDAIGTRGVNVRFARWQLMLFSQLFALGYFVGVLVTAAALVVFTDLAFGWSSTIDISNESIKRLVALVSAPFQWIPPAVPEPGLVDASRFYRLEGQVIEPDRAAQLGRWWPFVLVFTLCYGLLPRLILAVIASWRLHTATIALLESGPEIRALLDRLSSPLVGFEADCPAGGQQAERTAHPLVTLHPGAADTVINWNAVLDQEQLTALLGRWHLPTGQERSLAEWDAAELRTAALATLPPTQRVIVLTKGWEPPLLAFVDLIEEIRARLADSTDIVVVPLDISLQQVGDADAQTWNQALAATTADVAGTIQ